MSLYLCGGGSGSQIIEAYNDLKKFLDKNKPILYIPLAMEKEKYKECDEWFNKEIKNIGNYKYDIITSALDLSKKNFNNYGALYIGGGNTYKLLNDIKKYGNHQKILNYLNNNGIVFGGSAGAIIFGKDIDICKIDDKNNIPISDTSGLNLINGCSILCHLNKKNFKKNKDNLKIYSKKYKVLYLTEDTVIKIDKNIIKLIGRKKYIIFKDGVYSYHHFANFKNDIK